MQDLVEAMVRYGWMMWRVVGLSQDYRSAPAVNGACTTANTMRMLVSSALVSELYHHLILTSI